VQREFRPLGQHAVRLDHEEHIRVLHGNDDVLETALVADLDVAHGALEEGFRLGVAVLVQDVLFQRPGVHTNTNGYAFFLGGQQDFVLPLLLANIAGVNPDLGDAGFQGCQGVVVIEVDIGHDGHRGALDNVLQGGGVFRARDGHAHNVGAGFGQTGNFSQ